MPTNATSLPIPAPVSGAFVNGEVGVGISGAPSPGVTYFFSRMFVAEKSGLYLLKFFANGPCSIRVGRDYPSLSLLLTPAVGAVVESQVYLSKGANRFDVEVQPASSVAFAMLVYEPDVALYVSSGEGWVYEVGTASLDSAVPEGETAVLPVLSILPNWGASITERVTYLTDIPTSETASEQTRQVRLHPRRYFEADFQRRDTLRPRLDAFVVGIGRSPFWMPLWHEQFILRTGMASGQPFVDFPEGTLRLREFMPGDRVFINDGDPDRYELLTVASLDYDTDRLTWVAGPVEAWVSCRLIPVRKARIVDQVQFRAPVDRVAAGRIAFELVDPDFRFGASWGRCSPVWHFAINRSTDLSFSFDRAVFTMDNAVGPVEYRNPGDRALVTMRSTLTLRGRSNMVDFRRFIDRAAGRANRFYMPTRMADITPATQTVVGTFLDAVPAGYSEYGSRLQQSRSIIALVFKDGSPNIYRRISSVLRFGSVERFVLTAPLPSINRSRIERIQYMVPSRFDQDTFEFEHVVDESAAVNTSVVTRSVDGDGMPDIDCYVTSPVYPIEAVDEMRPSLSITGGSLVGIPLLVGALTLGLGFDGGAIATPLQTYNAPAEAIETQLAFDGGQLRTLLRSTTAEPESFNVVGLEITNGTLRVGLLSEELEPEGIDTSLTFDGGTLT